MHLKNLVFTLLLSAIVLALPAQQTTVYTEANRTYKTGIEFYEKGIFGLAQQEFQKTLDLLLPRNEPEAELLRTQAELHYAKSAVRLNQPDGEKLILDFARANDPDPLANQAILEMANYYYNSKDYEKAASLFASIDAYDLNREQRSEVKFKLGYSYFVKKKFRDARTAFSEIKEVQNKYYYPTNYYHGMTSFFDNNYDEAITSFKRVSKSKKYKPYIPYYIAQIYFAKGDYDEVIQYTAKIADDPNIKNRPEVNQLLGQAYFEKEDFRKARTHLEYYAANANKLRPEDFYQLGYVQYQDGDYQKAIQNFEQLSRVNSEMGQNAMFTLGDAYLQLDEKSNARNAFKAASKLDFNKEVQEDALYNYAKLSYELNFDREAVTALQSIEPTSKYHQESQALLSAIFLNTRDYEKALDIIEGLPNKSPEMRETYQKVAYFRAIQLYRTDDIIGAEKYFNKSLENPIDSRTKALAIYWLGELAHQEGDFDTSIRQMNKFLTLGKNLNKLPDESSIHTANYIQGYNYLKQKDYPGALDYFQKTIRGLKNNSTFIANEIVVQKTLGDAVLRAGDCQFKRNQYDQAIRFYNDAIDNRYTGFVYALYQKAIIEGLRSRPTDKILALDNIVNDYPESEYADNALFQLGVTYLEIGKLDQASRPLKRLTQNYPQSELVNQSLLKLGLISYNQGNLQNAISYYKQIFNYNPEAKEAEAALTALEEIYVDDLGQTDEYFAFLETIPGYQVKDDEKENINFKAAEAQYENGNYENAISSYTNYIRKYPNGKNIILAYYHRGESNAVLKQYTEALRDYEAVIAKGSSKYYTKALKKGAIISYNHAENFDKAFEYYSQLETATDNPDLRFEAQLGALRSA
ncbi:MAG: tetratricopeptide repeat protein, partial [Bacteroidota bacterium]